MTTNRPAAGGTSPAAGALVGVLAVSCGLAVAEFLAAGLFAVTGRTESSPVIAVGGAVIDATPTPVKEYAVREFGTYDKPLLLGGIAIVLLGYAAIVGVLARARPRTNAPYNTAPHNTTPYTNAPGPVTNETRPGPNETRPGPNEPSRAGRLTGAIGPGAIGLIGLIGLIGAMAAVTRPAAEPVDAGPALVGAVLSGAVLTVLLARLAAHRQPARQAVDGSAGPTDTRSPVRTLAPTGPGRRRFLTTAVLVAAGTVVTGGAAVTVRRAGSRGAARSRQAVLLPPPADPAPPLPAVAPGFHTANADFYRVDTALTVPRVDADNWRLRITGMVDRPGEFSLADLLARPLIERDITLNCVSNAVGGPYAGTARWLGVPLAPLLREVGVRAGADQVVSRSVDGMTFGTPVATLLDGRDAMLAVGMNGEPLPFTHGFPVRMLTPGLYGYAGSCKWLVELELSTFASFDCYWVRRGWAARAPVKTASRIDRPVPFASLPAGEVVVSGVAWAQRRGIGAVRVRVDDGPWLPADLLPAPASTDTWVQWRFRWAARPGGHTLRVRAVDRTGEPQTGVRAEPFPDGATGWHTIAVTIT